VHLHYRLNLTDGHIIGFHGSGRSGKVLEKEWKDQEKSEQNRIALEVVENVGHLIAHQQSV